MTGAGASRASVTGAGKDGVPQVGARTDGAPQVGARKVGPPKVVLLGMMTKMPVAGVVWQTVHYLVGFRRLGYDAWYVEAHARTPSMFMETEKDDGSRAAVGFIADVMRRFGLRDRWAYHALHEDGRCYGLGEARLRALYRDAALLINLHGGTQPLPAHAAARRLVYVGTDPVQTEVELAHGNQATIGFLEAHSAFFTFGENYGAPDCGVPESHRFELKPTRQPVVLDFWKERCGGRPDAFTTVANWRQPWRDIRFEGELYRWSKHHEFERFLDLPRRTGARFELALSGCPAEALARLEGSGWRVRDALGISRDLEAYRGYIAASLGEFTVAKDQNVRLRSGWFSDRSATYLAAGRPVITQDTGFGNTLPTGRGLFAFSTLDDVVEAVEEIHDDYERQRRAASEIAAEYFDYRVVLGRLLEEVGLPARAAIGHPVAGVGRRATGGHVDSGQDAATAATWTPPIGPEPFPAHLVIEPVSRRPIRLPGETLREVSTRPWPVASARPSTQAGRGQDVRPPRPRASIVVVTIDKLPFTRLCLESLLANTEGPPYEVIVVDNGSTDGTTDYLLRLARWEPRVRLQLNGRNLGFAAATNLGLSMAAGEVLVLLNNDTIVAPGWLVGLCRHLEDPGAGAVGPVTNRIGNEAQVDAGYRTYGGFLRRASERARGAAGGSFEIPSLTMFCFAMRREVHRRLGGLDESFGIGTLEDDDYSLRLAEAGYALLCAQDVLVHHFGQASFGDLVPGGEYDALLRTNRRRFEEKWGRPWRPYGRRRSPDYRELVGRVRSLVPRLVPEGATVLVASRGDDELLELSGRRGWHFPRTEDGVWAGHYPADSREAIRHLESLRRRGAGFLLIPRTGLWWLEHYGDFARHLERRYRVVHRDARTCALFDLGGATSGNGPPPESRRREGCVREGDGAGPGREPLTTSTPATEETHA